MNAFSSISLALASGAMFACGAATPPPAPPVEAAPPNPCPAGGAQGDAIGAPTAPEFDRPTALRAMESLDVSACAKKDKGASGCAEVQLQFEPSGNVSAAWACETTLSKPVRDCIEKRFKAISVPSFRDRAVLARAKACVGSAKK